jgi:hypothetical protein
VGAGGWALAAAASSATATALRVFVRTDMYASWGKWRPARIMPDPERTHNPNGAYD